MYDYTTSYQPNQSFYAADTTSLKETIVTECITDVINELFNEKGVRPINQIESPTHPTT